MRTAPIGPSNGMPESISAAEAALIASTSCGFSWSAPMTVTTTWVSLRKPSGNDGRSGRSIRRQVRIGGVGRAALTTEERAGDLARRRTPAPRRRRSAGRSRCPRGRPWRRWRWPGRRCRRCVATTAPWRLRGELAGLEGQGLVGAADGPRHGDGVSHVGSPSRARAPCGRRSGAAGPVPSRRPPDRSRPGSRRLTTDRAARLHVRTSGRRAARSVGRLATQAELGDDRPVALDVVVADVVEQAAAAADQHQQATPAVVVLLVDLAGAR